MKRNLVLFSLFMLVGAGVATAQTVVFNLGTAPTFVANTGRAEVLGQVTMTGDATCGTNADGICVSTQGTLQVLYQGIKIDNVIATANAGTVNSNGIDVCEVVGGVTTCNATGTYIIGPFSVSNASASGGVVSFGVQGAVDWAAGDQVFVRGVRGRVDQSAASVAGTDITGKLTASPSTIASFSPTFQVVATSADPLTIAVDAATILQCVAGGTGIVHVKEGYNTAFVDQGGDGTLPANWRPLFVGADARVNKDSHVNIVLTGLPSGIKIAWPATSSADVSTGATLKLVSQSASGDNALYVFDTADQAISDISAETFDITLNDGVEITKSGTNADFGTAYVQGQMYPPAPDVLNAVGTGPEVRYNHPLENVPPDMLLAVGPCTTNLLFPWMAFIPGASYDTGFAIANTSTDPYGTIPQQGTCTLNFYPTNDATLGSGPVALPSFAVTTPNIPSGGTFAQSLSNLPAASGADFTGYMIAVCKFQYGHGFAYITNTIGQPTALAQGYVALVIPDPVVNFGRLPSDSTWGVFQSGEGLAQ